MKPWSATQKGIHLSPDTEFKKGRINERKGKKCPEMSEDKHPQWMGDKVGYSALHRWVVSKLGKPNYCAYCHCEDKKRYHWANISHCYKRDLSDWIRLCVSCHKLYDLGRIKL